MGNDGFTWGVIIMLHVFQSTFPRGERQNLSEYLPLVFFISIHVPAWGTTSKHYTIFRDQLFQSTFPRGERQRCGTSWQYARYFNPRSRVGNDSGFCTYLRPYHDFNPRSSVGNDTSVTPTSHSQLISIHVPAWGTTTTSRANG